MDINVDFTIISIFIISLSVSFCGAQDSDTFYFSVKPHDQSVVEGTELTLLCDVSNRRHISFQWIQDGKPVTNTSRRFQSGRNLRILRITREDDAGAFQCTATNVTTRFSLLSGEAYLDIQWLDSEAKVEPKQSKPPKEVTLGSDIQLKCSITGNPKPRYYWYQNQYQIFNKDNVRIVDKGSRLKITGITARDNGVYSCRAENVAGAVDSMANYLLNVEAPDTPHLLEEGFTPYKVVLRNSKARLDCPFINATKVEWFANYEKLTNSSRYKVFENGSLYFPKVRNSDEGGYRCEGLSDQRDIAAQIFTSELVISYLDDFSIFSFEPRLIPKFPLVIPVHRQSRVKVFPPDGKPVPSYRWLNKNDRVIQDVGPIRKEGADLLFENPQQIDSGNYTFIVNNTAGEKRQSVWIIVSVPPMIRKGPQAKEAKEGESVSFSCEVTGTAYPVTNVIWHKDYQYIKLGSQRHHMDQHAGTLHITDLTGDDSGSYYCVANTTGQQLVTSNGAFLRVRRKLKFTEEPKDSYLVLDSDTEIKCIAEAEVKPKVHWIKGSWRSDGSLGFNSHVLDSDGILYFRGVQMIDAGLYTCIAHTSDGVQQAYINKTIVVRVVEKPRFRIRPNNTTVYEEQKLMLHCVASGVPKPSIIWDKNHIQNNWDRDRVVFLANGTMVISKVYMEDHGLYGCTANNSAGENRTEAFVYIAAGSEFTGINRDDENFDMMRTVIIAVCSAGAYLALVIGLTAFCSYRLLLQRRNRKLIVKNEKQNGTISNEQHELLMKERDRDSGGTQCRSDSDNRSHVSGLSSHPSHSSNSNSQSNSHTVSQSQSQRSHPSVGKTSLDRLYFPRHELQTMGILGKSQFGDVILAKARGIRPGELESQVVVKSLLSKEDHHYFEFNKELEMYSRMDHNNVVKVLGVCREAEPFIMITEHCDWGDLKQFLLASRPGIQRIPPLTVIQKIGMCNQVALGMEYLSNERFVHRDLAARNVLLTSRLELKISNLALSRDLYVNEYVVNNQTVIPLRWLSPEAALEADYSTKSDIWAYGVYTWEVFHLGDLPHKTRSNEELIKALKGGDITLEVTEQCPNEIIDLIHKCMSESPKDRPLFSDICNRMGELVTVYSQSHLSGGSSSPSVVSFPSMSSYTGGGVPGGMYMT